MGARIRGLRLTGTLIVVGFVLAGCRLPDAPANLAGPIPVPDECPHLAPRLEAIAALQAVPGPDRRVTASEPRTAVDVWGRRAAADIHIPRTARFLADFHRTHPVVARGRLPSVGVFVEVRSDGPLDVDLKALDEVVLLVLNTRYPDLRYRALLDCYRMRILGGGELRNRSLRIYVPSDPSACFQAGTITSRGDGGCDAIGAAIPGLRLRATAFGADPISLRWPATVIVTPGHHPTLLETPEVRAALTTVHEVVHWLDNEMGVLPHPDRLRAYEQRAYYAQNVIRLRALRGEVEVPQPFSWPRRSVPETAEDERA